MRKACEGLAACVLLAAGPALAAAAPAAPVPVAALVEQPNFSGLTASPDGRRVAVRMETADVATNRYRLEWLVIDPASGTLESAGDGGEAIYADPGLVEPGDLLWSTDGQSFYYRALVDGAIGLWEGGAGGGPPRRLLVKTGNIDRLLGVGPEGVTYLAGPPRDAILKAERSAYRTGILIDRTVDLGQSLMRGGWTGGRIGAQRLAGRWFKREGLLGDLPRERRRFDVSTGRDRLLGPEPVAPVESGPLVSPDGISAKGPGGRSAVTSERGGVTGLRAGIGAAAKQWQAKGTIPWLAWQEDGELVFAVRDAHKRDRLFRWKGREPAPRAMTQFDGTLSGGGFSADLPCARARDRLVCIAAGPTVPPRLLSISLVNGRQQWLLAPGAKHRLAASISYLDWEAGGSHFTGVLVSPPGPARRRPLVLTYYRCLGWLKGGEGGEWPTAALVDAGIAVACVNAPRQEGPQDAVANYRLAEKGLRALLAKLDREALIDPRRVGMGGFSFGSEVTLWMLTHTSLITAASIASPQIEPAYYWLNAGRGRDQPRVLHEAWKIGPPGTSDERWTDISPVRSIDRVTAPLLIQLPEEEARYVPELLAKLSRSASPSEAYAFPDEAHIKVQPAHQWQVMQRNLDWFRFWLLGAGDLGDAEAAARWRQLQTRGADPLPAD